MILIIFLFHKDVHNALNKLQNHKLEHNNKHPLGKSDVKCQQPIANCFVNPCDMLKVKVCKKHPKAVCVPDYCGGCNVKWLLDNQPVKCT